MVISCACCFQNSRSPKLMVGRGHNISIRIHILSLSLCLYIYIVDLIDQASPAGRNIHRWYSCIRHHKSDQSSCLFGTQPSGKLFSFIPVILLETPVSRGWSMAQVPMAGHSFFDDLMDLTSNYSLLGWMLPPLFFGRGRFKHPPFLELKNDGFIIIKL